jgi:hypothetical protein
MLGLANRGVPTAPQRDKNHLPHRRRSSAA